MSDNRKISHFKVLDHSTMSKCSDLSFGESHNSTLEHVTGSYDCLRNTIASYIDDATIKPMLGGRIIPSTVRKITACCGATVVGDQKEDVFCELGIYDLSNTNVGGGLRGQKVIASPKSEDMPDSTDETSASAKPEDVSDSTHESTTK
jgi:hypothetical protein